MASSDDETEVGPQLVSNYHFVDERDEPISISVLPIRWSENEMTSGNKRQIFLYGTTDNGLQKIYKQVIAWTFDLTNVTPEISVLSKEKSWIKLQKPRKSFQETIRSVLITVHCLSYAKRNSEATGKSIWDFLSKIFSSYEVRPSQNDLVDHMDLVSEALSRDDLLAKSQFLLKFIKEKPRKKKLSDEDVKNAVSEFIVDDGQEDMFDDIGEDESNEDEDLFDSVCSICDNGGNILCCEGRCMRSFHATIEDGEDCESLGLTKDEVEAIQNFFCKNCEHKQHQCFVCGRLGSSDKASGAEVFPCVSATCGHFYHPLCVSELLLGFDEVATEQLQKSIAAGESFTCPLHKCYVCKQGEDKMDAGMQFAVCRRCPTAYHRKCLPKDIPFEEKNKDEKEDGVIPRAWEGLLPNHRILIYCLKHEIDEELGTPIRDHIKFPGVEQKKTMGLKKKQISKIFAGKEKQMSTTSGLISKVSFQGKSAARESKPLPSAVEKGRTSKKSERLLAESNHWRKIKPTDASRKSLKENMKSGEVDRSSMADAKKISLGDRLYAYMTQETEQTKLGKRDTPDSEFTKTETVKPARKKLSSELPSLDPDSEGRLLSLMKDAASSINLKDVIKRHKIPSTHTNSLKAVVERTITMGKVEVSLEAVRTALKKLEEGGSSIEDAKAVCEPEVLNQIFKWKNKLKVYLAPFLYGMRYTSFGRHFTKVEKLQEIVDRLHWYVQNGDMIVDFCCGANDFSCLLKKKLEETGKKCLHKNFDIVQAKNDFNFEKRDWMTVEPGELAPGSQLIIGLNPPFGVKAALANKFINKALEFNPKLLILIVPSETERLDKKKTPYDLVWEDDQFLSGKSFYLPGSVDENDKQIDQWNVTAPPLCLWSRTDWTARHKDIAEKHDHISKQQEAFDLERNCKGMHIPEHPMEDGHGHGGDTSMVADLPSQDIGGHYGDTSMVTGLPLESIEVQELRQIVTGDEASSPEDIIGREGKDGYGLGENQSIKISRKRKSGKNKLGGGMSEKSPSDKQNKGGKNKPGGGMSEKSPSDKQNDTRHLASDTSLGLPLGSPAKLIDDRCFTEQPSKYIKMPSNVGYGENDYQHFGDKDMPHCLPANMTEGRSSLEGQRSKSIEMPSHTVFGNSSYQHFEPAISSSHMQFGTAYGGTTQSSIPDDIGWRYNMNNNEPYSSLNHRYSGGANLEGQFTGHVGDLGIPSQFQPYEHDRVISAPGYAHHQMGALPPSAYGHLGSAAEASYRMNMSAMDRYRPQLDEYKHSRMSASLSEQSMVNRGSIYDPRGPRPVYDLGFAPGPYQPFPQQGSGGWLDP